MTSYLFRNVSIWDGINDQEYPGEIVVENNRIKTVARGRDAISRENADEVIDGRAIVSLCEETGSARHLVTPFLQEAAKKAKQKNGNPTQKKEVDEQLSSSSSATLRL